MEAGVFAKVYTRSSTESVLDAIRADGVRYVQYNMTCAGLPTLPDDIPAGICDAIRNAFAQRGMVMSAISGTFNIINPDQNQRQTDYKRLALLAQACPKLSTSIITLCSGTRDTTSMWKAHVDNDSPDAWQDMLGAIHSLLDLTEGTGVILGIEPELSNVINSARKARLLLDTMQSSRLKIVMDGSNLLRYEDVRQMHTVFAEAFDLLGSDIQIVHAKDLMPDGGHGAAGTGALDYDLYIKLLDRVGYRGPLILHTLTEAQVPASVDFINMKLAHSLFPRLV